MTISSFLTPLSNAAQPCLPPISSLFGSASARPVFSGREAALQAELLLSLNPESLTPATINALENRPIHQLPSGLPGENDEKELSREERNQIWVTEPTVTYDVFRKINRVVVRKNEKEWNLGLHIDDAIVRNTPKAFIADGENTEFYDEEGNFICGIVYNVDVKEGAIDELGPLGAGNHKERCCGWFAY